MMMNKLTVYLCKIQRRQQKWPWLRSCYFGLRKTAPLLLIGILLQCLALSFFQPHGFFNVIYHLEDQKWLSKANMIVHSLSCIVFSMTLLLLCVAVAWHRGRLFAKRESIPSMVTALFLLFLINFRVRRVPADGTGQIILSGRIPFIEVLVIGLISAYFYHWIKNYLRLKSIWSLATATVFLGGVLKGARHLLNLGLFSNFSGTAFAEISSLLGDDQHQVVTIIMREIGRNLFIWCGFISPDQVLIAHTDSDLSRANLSAALIKDNLEGLPHPLNIYSLSDSFAVLGGYGQLLALILLFLLFSSRRRWRRRAWRNLVPVFLNINSGFLAEIPVFFNVVLLIPFVFVPVISILLGAFAIDFGLIPPSVYQVPLNTPTFLNAFMGTNGHWSALIFTIIILLISMALYYPFFKALDTPTAYLEQKRGTKNEK